MNTIKKWLSLLNLYLVKQTIEASNQIPLFAVVMMINFPLFGIFWRIDGFQLNQEFFLRTIATLLCSLLLFHKIWPSICLKALPALWHLTLMYCLPFFFTYLTLISHGTTLWLMNCISATFFLFLLTSVLDALILLFLGSSLAFIWFMCQGGHFSAIYFENVSIFALACTFIAAIVLGALFARDRELFYINKLSGIRLLSGSLAHDLKTPLASIYLQTELQEIIVEQIKNPDAKKGLKDSLNKIGKDIDAARQLINMQLNNIQCTKFDTKHFSIHSIKSLLTKACEDYPYKKHHQDLIRTNWSEDFSIWIEEVAFKNLIWNLLKNSFDFIEETGKGEVSAWLSMGDEKDNYNYLHIKDTALGISPEKTQIIFEPFYSDKKGGSGIGLAYCKLLMQAASGSISCKGVFGEYIHFIVKFPKVD